MIGYLAVDGESSPNGQLRVALPFQNGTMSEYSSGAAYKPGVYVGNHGGTIVNAMGFSDEGDNYIRLYQLSDSGTPSYIDHNDVDSGFFISICYTYQTVE